MNNAVGGNTPQVGRFASCLILISSVILIASCIVLKLSLLYGFYAGLFFSIIVLLRCGYRLGTLLHMAAKGIKECSIVFAVITLLGTAIAIWMASGIVPSIVFYGLEYIQHINYLLACFLITTFVAVFMGTAVGTVSTIGIALLAIGSGLGIPIPILLGSIISGAFVADRISPISSLVNLTLKTTNVKYQDYVRVMLKTLLPSVFISALVYYFLGQNYIAQIDGKLLQSFQLNLQNAFVVSPFLMLFPIIIVILAGAGIKVIPNISIGVVIGAIISMVLQKLDAITLFKIILFGYKANTGMPELNQMIRGGGILPMAEVLMIVAGAVALSSIFEGVNIISPLINSVIAKAKNKGGLVAATGFLSSLLTAVTCDQTVGILFLGKYLQKDYESYGMDRSMLARTISDTGTTIAPLMPWNVNALIILVITGVQATQYAPYAVLCYVTPIMTILFGYVTHVKKKQQCDA